MRQQIFDICCRVLKDNLVLHGAGQWLQVPCEPGGKVVGLSVLQLLPFPVLQRAIQAIVRFSFFAPSGHLLNSTCPV